MTELNQEMIERRAEEAMTGAMEPLVPGLPGLTFRALTNREKGLARAAYDRELKRLYDEGGMISESFIPHLLRKRCREVGLNYDQVEARAAEIQQRIRREMAKPEWKRLLEPYDQLTEEEVARLSPEEQGARLEAVQEHGRKALEAWDQLTSEEDKEILEAVRLIDAERAQLQAHTYQHRARVAKRHVEILHAARRADDPEQPYFESVDVLDAMELDNQQQWLALVQKWREFAEGRGPGFLSR